MWVFGTFGFLSAVQDKKDESGDRLLVRARDKKSLQIFIDSVNLAGTEQDGGGVPVETLTYDDIVTGEGTDYAYRVRMSKGTFALGVQFEILNFLEYGNFKDALTHARGKTYHDAAMSVWVDMLAVDDRPRSERYKAWTLHEDEIELDPTEDELVEIEAEPEDKWFPDYDPKKASKV